MGNQEFGSWIWKGIELGPEKWEMGTKSEFSSLKVRPQGCLLSVCWQAVLNATKQEVKLTQPEGNLFGPVCQTGLVPPSLS